MALRLTSKSHGIHASATEAFSKRYFTDVRLLYNKYSLETFVKICQHPIFRPSIRRVQLSSARYDEENFYDTVEDLMEGRDHHHSSFSEMIQRLSARCDAERFYYYSRQAGPLIDQAFGLLAESDHSLVLAVATNEQKSLGCSKVWIASSSRMDWWVAHSLLALTILVQAAEDSGCKVRGLEVQAALAWDAAMYESLYDDWEEWEVVRSLTELKLDLPCGPNLDADDNGYGAFHDLLSLTTNLKTLHIRSKILDEDDDAFTLLAEKMSCLPLEELHLAFLYVGGDTITELMKNLGPILCRLKIFNCNIAGSWKKILLSIQQHTLKLEELDISGTRRSWLKDAAPHKGITNVRSGIAKLLQNREDMLRIQNAGADSGED